MINFNTSNVEVPQRRRHHFISHFIISIHPMWRFRDDQRHVLSEAIPISIHPMWRFRTFNRIMSTTIGLFQYIQCGGSAFILHAGCYCIIHFNTSNVEVPLNALFHTHHQRRFQYIQCGGSARWGFPHVNCGFHISIHPMWRFRFMRSKMILASTSFQYIQCGGSADSLYLFVVQLKNFNTSNVEVPRR